MMPLRGLLLALLSLTLPVRATKAQIVIDTLVEVGGSRLHFHIVKGHGIPILFESGGGDDATVWKSLTSAIAEITGTTLITYDRSGFGTSSLDTVHHDLAAGVDKLETGLHKLHLDGNVFLVAHSLGGYYATMYAARHPARVRGAVLLDANLSCFVTDDYLAKNRRSNLADMERFKSDGRLGIYFIYADQEDMVRVMRQVAFPKTIPLVDFVSERTPFADSSDDTRWKQCHARFVAEAPNRRGVLAHGSGHYIFLDQQELVAATIIDQYAKLLSRAERAALVERSYKYALRVANEANAPEEKHRLTEGAMNSWGYSLLKQGDSLRALEVFRLNVLHHPGSANTYDSLAEAYETLGDTAAARKYYRRVLELNPRSTNAAAHLAKLSH